MDQGSRKPERITAIGSPATVRTLRTKGEAATLKTESQRKE